MEPVYGQHLGFVINSSDPEGRHRVQVFIPYLSNTLYSEWNDGNSDRIFKTPLDLPLNIQNKLKQILPWAEAAQPLFGGNTAATVNLATQKVGVNADGSSTLSNLTIAPANGIINGTSMSGLHTPSTSSTTGNSNDVPVPYTTALNSAGEYSTTSSDGLTRALDFNGGKSLSYDSDKKTSTGLNGDQVIGVVVANKDLLNQNFTINVTDKNDPTKTVTMNAIGYDYNPTHGIGATNPIATDMQGNPTGDTGPLELSGGAYKQLESLGITYSDSGVEGTSQYSVTIAPSNNTSSAAVASNEQETNKANGNIIDVSKTESTDVHARTPNFLAGGQGSPNGTFSVPNPGAKVWVFFYGGDIQKPIYFAAATEPSGSASFNKG
jgi:hypothetical protein